MRTFHPEHALISSGQDQYTWDIEDFDNPPSWITIDPTTGFLSGTPNAAGTFTFVIRAQDNDDHYECLALLSITINPGLIISPTSMPSGQVGINYSQPLSASGGFGYYSWSQTSGDLPPGLKLNGAVSVAPFGIGPAIVGQPTAAGTYSFTIQASGPFLTGTQSYTITINPPFGQASNFSSAASATYVQDGTAFAIQNDGVDVDLTGSNSPDGTNVLISSTNYGISQTMGAYLIQPYDINVSSSSDLGPNAVAEVSIINSFINSQSTMLYWDGTNWDNSNNITISGSTISGGIPVSALGGTPIMIGTETLTVNTSELPDAVGGTPYTQTLSVSGGTGNYTWSFVSGDLPDGFTLSSDGVISGQTAHAYAAPSPQYNFTVQATNAANNTTTESLSITIDRLAWDVNGDGICDIPDVVLIGLHWQNFLREPKL